MRTQHANTHNIYLENLSHLFIEYKSPKSLFLSPDWSPAQPDTNDGRKPVNSRLSVRPKARQKQKSAAALPPPAGNFVWKSPPITFFQLSICWIYFIMKLRYFVIIFLWIYDWNLSFPLDSLKIVFWYENHGEVLIIILWEFCRFSSFGILVLISCSRLRRTQGFIRRLKRWFLAEKIGNRTDMLPRTELCATN